MVLQYFIRETNDILSLVVVNEVVILQGRRDVVFTDTGLFTEFTGGRESNVSFSINVSVILLFAAHVMLLMYELHIRVGGIIMQTTRDIHDQFTLLSQKGLSHLLDSSC